MVDDQCRAQLKVAPPPLKTESPLTIGEVSGLLRIQRKIAYGTFILPANRRQARKRVMSDPQQQRIQAALLIAEDDLRRRIVEFSPQIRADVQVMAQIIRELVALEREKRGLDNPCGTLTLYPNKQKEGPAEPELIGKGYVSGRFYRAMAWTKPDKLKIALLPEKPK